MIVKTADPDTIFPPSGSAVGKVSSGLEANERVMTLIRSRRLSSDSPEPALEKGGADTVFHFKNARQMIHFLFDFPRKKEGHQNAPETESRMWI